MGTQSTTPIYIIEAEEAWVPSLPHQCISLKRRSMGTQSTTPMYIIEAEEAWVPSLPHQCISLKQKKHGYPVYHTNVYH